MIKDLFLHFTAISFTISVIPVISIAIALMLLQFEQILAKVDPESEKVGQP